MPASEVLQLLVRVTLAVSAAILLVLALRKPVRLVFGARLTYALWLLPLLTGLAMLAPARQVLIHLVASPSLAVSARPPHFVAAAMAGGDGASALEKAHSLLLHPDYAHTVLGLWLLGLAGAALVMADLQRRFVAELRQGVLDPAVVGVIRPRIVWPRDFDDKFTATERALVRAHEEAHIARQDSRLNGLSAALQCLFWFNPLVHLAAHFARIDQEMACDETVVARYPEHRAEYARALLKAQLAVRPLPLGCYWPSRSEHPLMARVALLTHAGPGRNRRRAGAVAIALLAAGFGVAAWAAQPGQLRLAPPLQAAAEPPASGTLVLNARTTPHPGSKAAVRKYFADLESGFTDFDTTMTPRLADTLRPLQPYRLGVIARLGGLKTIAYTGSGPQGQDYFLVTFDKGVTVVETTIAPDGRADLPSGWAVIPSADAASKMVRSPHSAPVAEEVRPFDKYVGYYQDQGSPGRFFHIYRNGDELFAQLTSQGATQGFVARPGTQITFAADAQGRASDLVLRQSSLEHHYRRVDDAVAISAINAQADDAPRAVEPAEWIARRYAAQYADPDRGALLRPDILGLMNGSPIYGRMTPGLAAGTRQQLSAIQSGLRQAGRLRSVAFERVSPQGLDYYRVTFDHLVQEAVIGPLTPDGKLDVIGLQAAPLEVARVDP